MNSPNNSNLRQYGWRRLWSIFSMLALSAAITVMLSSCGGNGDSTPVVEAPGAPENFTVERTPDTTLSATLSWSVPSMGGNPDSFEIYRSTTSGTVFQDDNQIYSVPAEDGKTNYTYVDNVGLTNVDTYWVVTAKNGGGETATLEVLYRPIGPPGGGGDTGYGNNFASALIFADGIGISGLGITGTWTKNIASIDVNTGLRPNSDEIANLMLDSVTTLPYLDPATAFTLDNVTYYKQQTVSTWQGEWRDGATIAQHVTAKWGDNLISQRLTATSTIRVEMVLSKALALPMTSYWMQSLYGTKREEMMGTDGTTYVNSTAFVFASNARLKIQKLDAMGNPDGAPLYNQTLWQGDGPGYLAGEINVAGNFTYGFVWLLKDEVLPPDITTGKSGTWRLTFSLDPDNSTAGKVVPAASNNTFIDAATNGVLVSNTEAYIDINVQ